MYVRRYGANMRTDGQTDTHIQTPDTWYDFFRKKETNNNKKTNFCWNNIEERSFTDSCYNGLQQTFSSKETERNLILLV